MKNLVFMAAIVLSLLAAACKHEMKPADAAQTGEAMATSYACPMHPEVTSDKPGKCPKCGMDLKAVDAKAASLEYDMQLAFAPAAPEAGKPAKLSFTPKIKGNDDAQVPLDEVHEKKLHVIVVSKDLGWYNHIHPEYQADGSYSIDETFPGGGEYIIFADYTPSGAGNKVQRYTVKVGGTPKKPETFTAQSLTTKTDGYAVTLKPEAGKFLTNNMNHLGVEVTDKGKPVTNFENIMGAKGHLVIISGDGQKYLHVHPDEVEGKLDLHTSFEQPGLYRAFFQFQTNGKVHTSYFTLDVKEGKPGELDTPEGHQEHGEHKEGAEKDEHKVH